jgi:4-hydroxy-2-oxoheptanedioate aldolase
MDKLNILTLTEQFQTSQVLLGFCLMYPAPGIVERIGPDWDWIWIDGQHGQHDYNSILECVRACERAGTSSVVRVPSGEYGIIGLTLDMLACGIMVPMINTAEQARAAVNAAKFPPLGQRSYGGRRPIDICGRAYSHTANRDILLIAQIETEEGLANVDEIATVPGVDVLFFGPDDMAMQLAIPMDQPRSAGLFGPAMEKMAAAAIGAGKMAGTVTPSDEILAMAMKMGYRLCVGSGDVALLAGGSKNIKDSLSRVVAGGKDTKKA